MAIDYARYMVENPDVYNMFRKPGSGRPNWTWDNGRKEGQYRREDGNMTSAETAAQYAQNHYNNFGKSEGRKQHQRVDGSYEARIRQIDGGGGGGGGAASELNAELAAMIKSLAKIAEDPNATPEEKAEAAEQSKTILTNFGGTDDKKKKSFLTPLGG
jgi:hypothetical protein